MNSNKNPPNGIGVFIRDHRVSPTNTDFFHHPNQENLKDTLFESDREKDTDRIMAYLALVCSERASQSYRRCNMEPQCIYDDNTDTTQSITRLQKRRPS